MENKQKKMKKPGLAIIIPVVLVAAISVVCLLNSGAFALKSSINSNTIDLPYNFQFRFPKEYAHIVEHTQECFGERITDTFVLKNSDTDISLFCITFGDAESGDWLGELKIDDVNVPITYTIFSPDEDEIEKLDVEGREAYDAMRESFGNLLNVITADRRFVMKEEPAELVLGKQVEMAYWNVVLPEAITIEETNNDSVYQADFSGMVNDELVMLYSVRVGGDSLFSPLGLFEIDGEQMIVSVEVYTLDDRTEWNQSDFENAYLMMDTINTVIDAIIDSDCFAYQN